MPAATRSSVACQAGARPNSTPTSSAAAAQNATTRRSNVSVTGAGQQPLRNQRRRDAAESPRRRRASTPPMVDSTRLSVSSWRMMRRRPAPSAERTASSRVRTRGARQQQVGDVGAADQQHEADDAEEQHRREAQIAADHGIVHRLEPHAAALVGLRKLARQRRRRPPSGRTARRRCATPGFMRPTTCSMYAVRACGGAAGSARIAQMLLRPSSCERPSARRRRRCTASPSSRISRPTIGGIAR